MTQIDIHLINQTQRLDSQHESYADEQAQSAERYLQAQSKAQQGYEQSTQSKEQGNKQVSHTPSNTRVSEPEQKQPKQQGQNLDAADAASTNADAQLTPEQVASNNKAADDSGKPVQSDEDDFYAQLLAQMNASTQVQPASDEASVSLQNIDTDAWPQELKQAIAALSPEEFAQFKAHFSELAQRQGMSDAQVSALGDALTQVYQGVSASTEANNANAAATKNGQVVVNPSPQGEQKAQLHAPAEQAKQAEQSSAKFTEQGLRNQKGQPDELAQAQATKSEAANKAAVAANQVAANQAPSEAKNAAPTQAQLEGKNSGPQQVANNNASVILKSEHINVQTLTPTANVATNTEALAASATTVASANNASADIKTGIELNLSRKMSNELSKGMSKEVAQEISKGTELGALDISKSLSSHEAKDLKPAQLSAALMSHLQSQGNGAMSQAIQSDMSQWQHVIQQGQNSPIASERAIANAAATANAAAMLPVDITKGDAAIQLQQRVNMMLNLANQQAEIRIDPPELGSMQVRVRNEGEQAHVHFLVQNQQAKETLEQAMPRLRDLLAQQGLELGESQVDEQGQQGFAEQSQGDEQGQQGLTAQQDSLEDEPLSDGVVVKNAQQKQGIDFYA